MSSTRREVEVLGRMADKADNYLGMAELPLPDSMKIDGLIQGLAELSEELKALYTELSGNNPWGE